MIARIREAYRHAPWLMAGFTLALAFTLFFGVRTLMGAIYWADPEHRDQPVAGWMTPRYAALSWRVPPEVVLDSIEAERGQGRPRRIADIAADRGVDVGTLVAQIEAAILAHRAVEE